MSDGARGFHPWTRLVERLGRIKPHRQLYLLCAVSVVVAGVIVASAMSVLVPTHRSLEDARSRLVPAVDRLDVAERNYRATAGVLQNVLSADPTVRADAITDLTALNTAGDTAWNRYRRSSAGLVGERALQRSFVRHRQQALKTGGAFVVEAVPSAAGLAGVTQASSRLQRDLDRIKDMYEQKIQRALSDASNRVGSAERQILLVSIPLLVALFLAFAVAIRSARTREVQLEDLDRTLHEESERNELEARLQRSFEMAHTQATAYEVVRRALLASVPTHPAELLVADSSRAHFRQVTATDEQGGPGCPVMGPKECPAATWGQTQVWSSSTALDACPHLQGRPTGECSAVCVPVSIGGNTVGVLHATGPEGQAPDATATGAVELIARKVGERVGMLRAFERSETQAHTDPLTGLMNRRSLEANVRELIENGHFYVAAYGDLDHFKDLNDVYGHDAGDRALRLFARVLRDTVRPNDITSRYGGEEFVIVLPDCSMDDAYVVVDRIRERLALAQVGGSVPRFTVSFGIAASRPEITFSETLEAADAALLKAKGAGRDRVVVSGEGGDDVASLAGSPG